MRWRSCRQRRCRTTELPTDLGMTKPTFGGRSVTLLIESAPDRSKPEGSAPIATRSLADPPRTPRKAWANSAERRMRFSAASTSGGKRTATLATASGEDRAAGAGRHALAEAVHLGPAAVVGLESPLGGHCSSPRAGTGTTPPFAVGAPLAGAEAITRTRKWAQTNDKTRDPRERSQCDYPLCDEPNPSTGVDFSVDRRRPQRQQGGVIHRRGRP